MDIEMTRALIVVPPGSRSLAPIEPTRAPRVQRDLAVYRDPHAEYLSGNTLPNTRGDSGLVRTKGVYIDIYV